MLEKLARKTCRMSHQNAGQDVGLHLLVLAAEELLVRQLAALAVDGLAPLLNQLRGEAQLRQKDNCLVTFCVICYMPGGLETPGMGMSRSNAVRYQPGDRLDRKTLCARKGQLGR